MRCMLIPRGLGRGERSGAVRWARVRALRAACASTDGGHRSIDADRDNLRGLSDALRRKVLADFVFELCQLGRIEVELPLEVRTHLALHLVDLLERKHALADNTPALVAVCVVANDFRGDHEGGDEQTVARGTPSSRKAGL